MKNRNYVPQYCRIPIIRPGLIQHRKPKGFGVGLISRMKKAFQNEPRECQWKYVFKLKTHNKATISPIQYCHLVEGGLYPGGGGGGL